MESSVNERISDLIKELRLSKHAFAQSIGKSSSAINFIIDGRSKPSFDVLEAICEKYPEVNASWLLKGEGDMWNGTNSEISTVSGTSSETYLISYLEKLEDQFKRMMSQIETKDKQIESKDRQIERLMDLLGKLDLGGKTPWGKMLPHPATEEMEAA